LEELHTLEKLKAFPIVKLPILEKSKIIEDRVLTK